jgi:hypothetical protein
MWMFQRRKKSLARRAVESELEGTVGGGRLGSNFGWSESWKEFWEESESVKMY